MPTIGALPFVDERQSFVISNKAVREEGLRSKRAYMNKYALILWRIEIHLVWHWCKLRKAIPCHPLETCIDELLLEDIE